MRKLLLFITSMILLINNSMARNVGRELDSVVSKWESLAKFSGSIVVLQQGNVLLNKGYGVTVAASGKTPTENTLYLIGESTEMFTAALIFKLWEEKKLSFDDSLTKYIPELKGYGKVTIKDLLTHRSGIADYFTNSLLTKSSIYIPRTRAEIISIIASEPLRFEPGAEYFNSFSNYYLLGIISEKITNKPYYQTIQEYILKPANIKDAGFNFTGLASWDKANGYTILNNTRMIPSFPIDSTICFAAAGLYTSPNGMYKWATALLEHKILRKNSWQIMTNQLGNNFGHGWEFKDVYGKRSVGHTGEVPGFVNHFYIIPEDSTIIIIMSNDFESETLEIFDDITAVLYDKPYELPVQRTPVFLQLKKLEYYVGRYALTEDVDMNLYIKEGQIWGKIGSGEEFTLIADVKPDEFFMNGIDITYKFYRDKKTNLITHLVLRHNRREEKWEKWQ